MLSFCKNRLSDFSFSNRLLNFARNHVVSNSLTLTNPVTAGEQLLSGWAGESRCMLAWPLVRVKGDGQANNKSNNRIETGPARKRGKKSPGNMNTSSDNQLLRELWENITMRCYLLISIADCCVYENISESASVTCNLLAHAEYK